MGAFVASEKVVVRVADLMMVHPMSRKAANLVLSRLHRKGWLQRVKRGLYIPVSLAAASPNPAVEHAWPLAMELFAPCYISGWTAAEHWDLTEQIFNSIAVVTAHPQRQALQSFSEVKFRTKSIAAHRIFGSEEVWIGSRKISVADPHRLIIDILDSPELGGGGRHTLDVVRAYWRSSYVDASKLMEYAKQYDKGTVFKRLGFTTECLGVATNDWLKECEVHMSAGISRLDPSGPSAGRIVSRWRLRINIPVNEG